MAGEKDITLFLKFF